MNFFEMRRGAYTNIGLCAQFLRVSVLQIRDLGGKVFAMRPKLTVERFRAAYEMHHFIICYAVRDGLISAMSNDPRTHPDNCALNAKHSP